MASSVYRIIEVVGVSDQSWEDAARSAIETASGSVRDLRVAEVTRMDVTIDDGRVQNFRVQLNLSFEYDQSHPRTPLPHPGGARGEGGFYCQRRDCRLDQ